MDEIKKQEFQPIEIRKYILGDEEMNAVNARDVYQFVGNKRQFVECKRIKK